ncbi:MAG: hypothetical protein KDD82_21785 [Planctomycetes bacterium]|nr:hypothetical protein [Planctomycetota bacterium]
MDDFEAFRQRKLAAKKSADSSDPEAEEKLGWVDGLGPAGVSNPKVKGFVLGRYARKKIDPATLERPAGYESTSLADSEHKPSEEELKKALEDREGPEVKGFQRF